MRPAKRSRLLNFARLGGIVEDPGRFLVRLSSRTLGRLRVAECRLCAADIRWVATTEGERLAVDERGTRTSGPGRYMETEPGSGVVQPVAEASGASALIDHHYTCPYGQLDVGGKGESARKSRARDQGSA